MINTTVLTHSDRALNFSDLEGILWMQEKILKLLHTWFEYVRVFRHCEEQRVRDHCANKTNIFPTKFNISCSFIFIIWKYMVNGDWIQMPNAHHIHIYGEKTFSFHFILGMILTFHSTGHGHNCIYTVECFFVFLV